MLPVGGLVHPQRRVATYHVTVSGKRAPSEFIHIHNVNILYCRATLAFSLELAGIRIHCTPFESAPEAESKIDSTPPLPLCR